jgi:Ulp1 family protease
LDFSTLTKADSWVSHAVVDEYVELLRRTAPGDVHLEKCHTWININGTQAKRNDLAKKWAKSKPYKDKSSILWPMYGKSHFAVCQIDIAAREIRIYDSIESTTWSTTKLESFLSSIFDAEFQFVAEKQLSRQQKNSNDCGVYTMANIRSITEAQSLTSKRMFGAHQSDTIRKKAVTKMRTQMTRELQKKKLEIWK